MQILGSSTFLRLQNKRLIGANTPMIGRSELVPIDFHCTEGLSQIYEIDVRFASQDANIELKQMIGQPVTLSLELTTALASSERRHFHGYVTNFSHLDTDGGLTVYRATLRPWLWMLSRRQDQRIFQEETAQSILSEVFRAYGALASFEFRLSKPTPNRSYCTQYRETDLTFALRLMEEEGLFFYFEHTKTGHKLIVTDSSTTAKPIGGLSASLLYSQDEILDDVDVVTAFHGSRQLESNVSAIKTADYKVPAARRSAVQHASIEQGDVPSYEIYDYLGAHAYPAGDRGNELARFRAEALAAGSKIFSGVTTSRRLMPRHFFELEGHYDHTSTNPGDNQFMVVTATHRAQNNYQAGDGAAAYSCSFTCIRKKIPYRPPLTIERPVIAGPQTVTIVGPKGEEIYTDALGRVKGQFHWDRLGQMDHRSSCWMRVGQQWAGKGFGMIQIPRIGEEAVVLFLDGNPDRPLIISRVYNAVNVPPWTLPANATQSGILTRSSKGATSANANALRFEDKKGQEEIWIHAEKDQRIEVEHDESHTVGHDRSKSVGRDETAQVGRHWALSTGGYKQEKVALASVSSVGLGAMFNVGMAYNVNVGGLYLRNVGLQMASTVGMSRTDRVVQDWTAHVGHSYIVTVRGKAVGDAVNADQANPIEPSPDFAPQLPAPVSSPESNQIRITDQGQASLSGSKTAQLIGPGGTVTIDEAGIHLKGKAIYLDGPVSQSGGSANNLSAVTEADCAECAKKMTSQNPVDIATGQKVLTHVDFVLPGRLPIRWARGYRSADQRVGSLGVAWKLPFATEVRESTMGLTYFDNDGRQLQFPALAIGSEHFHPIEKYTLARMEDDANGPVYVLRLGSGAEERYVRHPADDKRWQLSRITTRDGQWLSLAYTSQGWLCEVRNNVYRVRCMLDAEGRITSVRLVQDQRGKERELATYTYDAHGDLVQAVDRAGLKWRYAYKNHLLAMYQTPAGVTHASEWDGDAPNARCQRTYAYTVDSTGHNVVTRDTRFAYEPSMRITRVTDALGRTTEYRYNGLWAVDRIVHSDGSVELVHFDEAGSMAGFTDALGRKTLLINDPRGNPTTIVDPAGNITRVSYNAMSLPEQVIDPMGQIWQRSYDDAGNLVSETDPLGNVTTYGYERGLLVRRTDALGNVTKMQWNDAGQLAAVTDCSGHTTAYTYDEFGALTQTTDAIARVSRQTRNDAGQVVTVQPAGFGVWKSEYDDAGRLIAQTDPLGRVTRSEWDAYGQLVVVTDPAGGQRHFVYDSIGRLAEVVNENGDSVSFEYDARNRLIEQKGFDGRRQCSRYSAAGEIIEQIDHGQDGLITTRIVYDAAGRPIERRGSDGSEASYRFDARGALTQAQAVFPGRKPVQVTFEYDAAGRRTAEVQSHHGRIWRLSHELDAIGNRSTMRVPNVGLLAWQRYGSGHVHGVLLDQLPLASFERDALHREILRVQGTCAHHFEYAENGLLSAHSLQRLQSHEQPAAVPQSWRVWQYDSAAQLIVLDDVRRGAKTYGYDALSRLIGVTDSKGTATESFQYDRAGNLLAISDGVGDASAGRANGNRLSRFVSSGQRAIAVDYSYDGHGNRIARTVTGPAIAERPEIRAADGVRRMMKLFANAPSISAQQAPQEDVVTRYSYDGSHQLTSIRHEDGAQTEYTYDALGRRIAKQHTGVDGTTKTTFFVWDGDWMLQEVKAGRMPFEDEPITYVQHPDNWGPLTRLSQGQRLHYVSDHLGTPQELYGDNTELVWVANMSAYGRAAEAATNSIDNPIRLPGQYYDVESGLHYNRFRYYDPESGRYVSQDPIGMRGGLNVYGYASNPLIAIDPFGLEADRWNGVGGANQYGAYPDKYGVYPMAPVNSECVQKYLHENYGKMGAWLANAGNVQQYLPSMNPDEYKSAIKDSGEVVGEKLVITKGPGVAGKLVVKTLPSVGGLLTGASGFLSGAAEIFGAFLTPFGTTAMEMAQSACTCKNSKFWK